MNLKEIDICYFLGIGGIGMSALARYFHKMGKTVMGYDRTSTPLTTELQVEGIDVHFKDSVVDLPAIIRQTPKERILVVYTPAIPSNHQELTWFRAEGFAVQKRSAVLGWITQDSPTIAVAGTHGKTTTTSIIAHLLHASGHGCNAFLGGITANYSTNLLFESPSAWTVVEADEFDRSFLALAPNIAVITSVDADHLDIYGTHEEMLEGYKAFAEKVKEDGKLIIEESLPSSIEGVRYGFEDAAAIRSSSRYIHEGRPVFDIRFANGEQWEQLPLPMPGRHNHLNTIVAVAIAHELGISKDKTSDALASFRGIKRRFEYQEVRGDVVYIDDYAHHPSELTAAIDAAKEQHPGKRVTGVFQPHLFSRTKDHADGFAEALSLLDEILLLDIYPAREEPIEGVDSQWLLDKIDHPHKKHVTKTHLLDELKQRHLEVLMTLGAGDIDQFVQPIAKMLSERETA